MRSLVVEGRRPPRGERGAAADPRFGPSVTEGFNGRARVRTGRLDRTGQEHEGTESEVGGRPSGEAKIPYHIL